MSDWVGPGVYRIETYKDRKIGVVLKDNDKSEKAAVVLKSGTVASLEGAKGGNVSVSRDSPTYYRCRWNIAPTQNGSGTYWIVAASDNAMMLNTFYMRTADNTQVELYKAGISEPATWWYLTVAGANALLSPNLGKGSNPGTEVARQRWDRGTSAPDVMHEKERNCIRERAVLDHEVVLRLVIMVLGGVTKEEAKGRLEAG